MDSHRNLIVNLCRANITDESQPFCAAGLFISHLIQSAPQLCANRCTIAVTFSFVKEFELVVRWSLVHKVRKGVLFTDRLDFAHLRLCIKGRVCKVKLVQTGHFDEDAFDLLSACFRSPDILRLDGLWLSTRFLLSLLHESLCCAMEAFEDLAEIDLG